MLNYDYLKTLLHYDLDTGVWTWRVTNSNRAIAGAIAGTLDTHGYWIIRIDNKRYRAHRLAWLYMTGVWPKQQIDHIDRNRLNNKWNNLREATPAQNSANCKLQTNNSSGHRGVRWCSRAKKWHARIVKNNKHIHLGLFDKFEDAVAAYEKAAQVYFGEFYYQVAA